MKKHGILFTVLFCSVSYLKGVILAIEFLVGTTFLQHFECMLALLQLYYLYWETDSVKLSFTLKVIWLLSTLPLTLKVFFYSGFLAISLWCTKYFLLFISLTVCKWSWICDNIFYQFGNVSRHFSVNSTSSLFLFSPFLGF